MSLKLNLSDQEAKSEAREFKVLPTGTYICNIVEVKDAVVGPNSQNNAGKPYWNVRFVVDQGDQYDGRNIFSNIMLFEGALYSIKQLVSALFPDNIVGSEIEIPEPDAFEGKKVAVVGRKYAEGSAIKRGGKVIGTREADEFAVSGFRAVDQKLKQTTKNDLLP